MKQFRTAVVLGTCMTLALPAPASRQALQKGSDFQVFTKVSHGCANCSDDFYTCKDTACGPIFQEQVGGTGRWNKWVKDIGVKLYVCGPTITPAPGAIAPICMTRLKKCATLKVFTDGGCNNRVEGAELNLYPDKKGYQWTCN